MQLLTLLAFALPFASAHYTFPTLKINSTMTPQWANVRRTNNYQTRYPVTDVMSIDLRCYTSQTNARASKITVSAGSQIEFGTDDGTIYHPSTTNIYMARAPSDVSSWDGSGNVWFKIHEISAVTDGGGNWIYFPSNGLASVPFTIPRNLPSGQYLVRIENIALHSASFYGGAQFYIACGELEVVNGGSGSPGPLVAFPGAYTGNEPGILINIHSPIPTSYTMPGPAVWRG